LAQHRGRAVVFKNHADMSARIDDPALNVTKDSVLVLRNCGPRGYPGMAEIGNMPIPAKLLRGGIRDIVRISDARMSGTAFGTVVLHVSPEAAAGGPLSLVKNGDRIKISIANKRIDLLVSPEELASRQAEFLEKSKNRQRATRGYEALYANHVQQAELGCDFDFLVADK
jgi:dihydroxyacid dehydratase/phosphogluconate dehydratase